MGSITTLRFTDVKLRSQHISFARTGEYFGRVLLKKTPVQLNCHQRLPELFRLQGEATYGLIQLTGQRLQIMRHFTAMTCRFGILC